MEITRKEAVEIIQAFSRLEGFFYSQNLSEKARKITDFPVGILVDKLSYEDKK